MGPYIYCCFVVYTACAHDPVVHLSHTQLCVCDPFFTCLCFIALPCTMCSTVCVHIIMSPSPHTLLHHSDCTSMDWDKDGDLLAITHDKDGEKCPAPPIISSPDHYPATSSPKYYDGDRIVAWGGGHLGMVT